VRSILVVDDDERLLYLISNLLKINGYNVAGATSAQQARGLLLDQSYDIMVIDWMMPRESGIALMKSIRTSQSHKKYIPAIMLTARSDIDSKLSGFEAGFDDYVTKPFDERELMARIEVLISRSLLKPPSVLKLGDFFFDMRSGSLVHNGVKVDLSTTEISLLRALCQKPNYPISRNELANRLSFRVSERTIDVQITRLRQKIGDTQKPATIIRTVRYEGYAICPYRCLSN
jgi:two-component system phosphate regulon response regulator OmpR